MNREFDDCIHIVPRFESWHVDKIGCHCCPTLTYVDPVTRREVWTHNAKETAN